MVYGKFKESIVFLPLTLRSLTLTSGLTPTSNRCISDFAIAPLKFGKAELRMSAKR